MKSFYLLRIAALLLVLFLSSYLPAQTNISGTVSGVWNLAGSPYLIVGDANVPTGSTLQIEAGVSVQFTGEFILEVFGNIQAIGTEQDSIEFKSISTYSKGLHIINGQDTCRFVYCMFKDFVEHTNLGNNKFKGGALYALNSKLAMDHCTFNNNMLTIAVSNSTGYGGALCLESCTGYIQNSTLISNHINSGVESVNGYGGALYINNVYFNIRSNVIQGNYIVFTDGGSCMGGGVYTKGIVENNTISNNFCQSHDDSGGGSASGGGIYTEGGTIRNNHIYENYCDSYGFYECPSYECSGGYAGSYGGGIYGGSLVENNVIHDNDCHAISGGYYYYGFDCKSYGEGGGICNASQILNNLVYNNGCSAVANGSYQGGCAIARGGGINNGMMQNNTLKDNWLVSYGVWGEINGYAIYGGSMENCIVWGIDVVMGTPLVYSSTASYSCIEGGYGGTGNISTNPLWVSGPNGSFYLAPWSP